MKSKVSKMTRIPDSLTADSTQGMSTRMIGSGMVSVEHSSCRTQRDGEDSLSKTTNV